MIYDHYLDLVIYDLAKLANARDLVIYDPANYADLVIYDPAKRADLVIYEPAKRADLVICDQDSSPDGRGRSPMVSSLSRTI